MGGQCCVSTKQSCAPRSFLTKQEKVEMLKEYQEALEKEVQGVKEKISHIEKD